MRPTRRSAWDPKGGRPVRPASATVRASDAGPSASRTLRAAWAASRWATASPNSASSSARRSSSSPSVRPAASSSETWKRSRSISRARARSSPPMAASSASTVANSRTASASGAVSTAPNLSSASRWAAVARRRWWACCPWRSRRRRPCSARDAAVSRRPSTYARLRPSAGTTRRSTTSRSPSTNRPSTTASAAPVRTIDWSHRPPSRRSTAPMSIVLPAPVSPVTAVSPGPNTTSTSSMTPRPVMRSSTSIAQSDLPPGRHGLPARHRCRAAGLMAASCHRGVTVPAITCPRGRTWWPGGA